MSYLMALCGEEPQYKKPFACLLSGLEFAALLAFVAVALPVAGTPVLVVVVDDEVPPRADAVLAIS